MEHDGYLTAARSGNLHAFNHLMSEYQELIYSLVYYLSPGQDCDQMMYTAIRHIYIHLPDFLAGDFQLWLIKLVLKACRGAKRSWVAKRRGSETKPGGRIVSAQPAPPAPKELEFLQQMAKLPPELREVLILIDLLQLDYRQASTALEVPVPAVRSQLAKARQLFTIQNHKPLQAV